MGESIVSVSTRIRAASVGTSIGLAAGLVAFFATGHHEFAVIGFGGYLIVLAALVAVGAQTFVVRMPHESSVRSALAAATASAPLVVSLPWAALCLSKVAAAIAGAESRDLLIAVGMSESLMSVVLGGYLTAGLALGVGLTLDGVWDRGLEQRRTTLWFLVLSVVAGSLAYVVGGFCDRTANGQTMGPTYFSSGALVAVSDARWNSMVAIGVVTVLTLRAAFATMRVPARFQGDWTFPLGLTAATVGLVTALVVGSFAYANHACRAMRPEGFTRHLDAFSPLTIPRGEHSDSGASVVVQGLLVDAHGSGPATRERFAALAVGEPRFAVDARVDHATLDALVHAMAASDVPAFRIVGVIDEPGWYAVAKDRASTPLFGAILPVVAERRVAVRAPEGAENRRSLRVVLHRGATSYAPTDSSGRDVPPESGEVVTLVLGPDATAADVLVAVAQFDPQIATVLVTADVALPDSVELGGLADVAANAAPTEQLPPSAVEPIAGLMGSLATDPGILRDLANGAANAPVSPVAPPTGSVGPVAVRAGMMAISPAVRRCYERALRSDPATAGRANVSFTIGTGGRVTSAEVTSSDLPASVTTCVERVVRDARFEVPDGDIEVRVSYPFTFRAD